MGTISQILFIAFLPALALAQGGGAGTRFIVPRPPPPQVHVCKATRDGRPFCKPVQGPETSGIVIQPPTQVIQTIPNFRKHFNSRDACQAECKIAIVEVPAPTPTVPPFKWWYCNHQTGQCAGCHYVSSCIGTPFACRQQTQCPGVGTTLQSSRSTCLNTCLADGQSCRDTAPSCARYHPGSSGCFTDPLVVLQCKRSCGKC